MKAKIVSPFFGLATGTEVEIIEQGPEISKVKVPFGKGHIDTDVPNHVLGLANAPAPTTAEEATAMIQGEEGTAPVQPAPIPPAPVPTPAKEEEKTSTLSPASFQTPPVQPEAGPEAPKVLDASPGHPVQVPAEPTPAGNVTPEPGHTQKTPEMVPESMSPLEQVGSPPVTPETPREALKWCENEGDLGRAILDLKAAAYELGLTVEVVIK